MKPPDRRGPSLGGPVGRWLPVVGWAALIFAFSATPNLRFASDDLLDLVVRKIGHAGIYAILALLLVRALAGADRRSVVALLICALYATSDELHQAFVAGRTPSAIDVGVDTLGAAIAIALVAVARARFSRQGSR
jgi:VanZ family protein